MAEDKSYIEEQGLRRIDPEAALDDQDVALSLGGGVGRARAPVEQGDLAEHRAGPEHVEDHLLALPGDFGIYICCRVFSMRFFCYIVSDRVIFEAVLIRAARICCCVGLESVQFEVFCALHPASLRDSAKFLDY